MTIVTKNSLTLSNVNDGTITHYAYSWSADGTDRFTTVYPNLNLGDNTKTFVGAEGGNNLSGSIRIDTATQKTQDGDFNYLTYKPTRDNTDWFRFFLIPEPGTPNMTKVTVIPNTNYTFSVWLKGTGQHTIYAYNSWTATNTPWSLQINLTSDWKLYTFTVTSKDVIPANPVQFFIRSNNGTEINLKKPKVEQGSVATPYMPSSSEVTTADWPSYIGQYTDFTQANSTNPSAYTWSLIRGNDGKDGANGPQGPAGSNGDPGKIVSDAEPTTKFKGLTWKYSGMTAINASDGTNIQPSTEYYWNDKNWVLNQINAHNINVDDLSAISTTLTNGKFISNWSSDNATGTTTIEKNHLIINSANASLNTENTIALDNEQGMMMTYNNKTNKRTISVGVNFQGLFVTDSTGPYVSVTPTGIVNSVDVSWTTIGSYAAYRRDGRVVTIRVVGAKTSAIGNIYIGTIPLKDCPAASVMGTALAWSASVANDKHIQINGLNQQNSGSVTILSAAANQEYTFQFTYQV